MTKYRPFINAVQWTGTNITEIRQFVRNSGGVINNATIVNGVLTLGQTPGDQLCPDIPIQVFVTDWVVITGKLVTKQTDADFVTLYELDP